MFAAVVARLMRPALLVLTVAVFSVNDSILMAAALFVVLAEGIILGIQCVCVTIVIFSMPILKSGAGNILDWAAVVILFNDAICAGSPMILMVVFYVLLAVVVTRLMLHALVLTVAVFNVNCSTLMAAAICVVLAAGVILRT